MYERFTDRARTVMQLANQEAKRFNHEYIGTEHILLGLVKEGSGVAAYVLKDLDLDLRKLRLEVEKFICCGPCRVTMGNMPLTPRAKKVIADSLEEAKKLNHNYVGTEHLLLGLLRDYETLAAQVLMNLGLTLGVVRGEVLRLLGCEMSPEEKSNGGTVYLSRPLMSAPSQESIPEHERIRSLESQLWNIRVVLGASAGGVASALLSAEKDVVVGGLILGGIVAALGGRILGAVAGGVTGFLLGCTHLPGQGGTVTAALLGALAGVFIAEIGASPGRRPWWK